MGRIHLMNRAWTSEELEELWKPAWLGLVGSEGLMLCLLVRNGVQ